jgi:hypothetical protein
MSANGPSLKARPNSKKELLAAYGIFSAVPQHRPARHAEPVPVPRLVVPLHTTTPTIHLHIAPSATTDCFRRHSALRARHEVCAAAGTQMRHSAIAVACSGCHGMNFVQ